MSDVDDFEWLRRSASFRDKSRVRSAMEKQDEIRRESGEGNLSAEVRKWRDKRK
jgi:hypothetical protein